MTGDKHPLQDLIQGDLDGELTAAERAELARLLLKDPEARRLQDHFRETDRLLRDVADAEPPAGLREAILAGHAGAALPGNPGHRQFGWPAYRIAAVILGGLLIVGLGILARDGDVTGKNLQGAFVSPAHELSIRAEGVEVHASLQRVGDTLRLELDVVTTIPCEVIAAIDPVATTFVGKTGDAQLTAARDRVTIQPAMGRQAVSLEFSGAAPIQLQLRSGGRLLGEGTLAVDARPE